MTDTAEKFEFRAETQRVLSLVINSLYTNTEVFLRELVSNASDALDKARFLQLTERDAIVEVEDDLGIEITLDNENKCLIVSDNGVGMSREELINNLGTIAKSGTGEFAEKLSGLSKEQDKDRALELIGQFGVGFYSVFMVASRVDVETLSMRQGAEPLLWRSSGEGSFTIVPGERQTPGTTITVHLNEDSAEFSKKWRIDGIVKKYSDFVTFPIKIDGEVANRSAALWREPRSKVTEEQHADFFKHITQGRQGDKPLVTVHYAVDAPVQFTALLYVPETQAVNMFMFQKERPGLRLYAKRVLIMENCEKLIPIYLRFVAGVVDSEDLDLNVSRETLQENRVLSTIEAQLTKQILKKLSKVAEDNPDQYAAYWKEFGLIMKEGLSIDHKNKDTLVELCRFESDKHGQELISLAEYVERMGDDQKAIYYVTGIDPAQVRSSPHLEVFRQKGYDVLLMTDPIDEWVVQAIGSYKEKPMESIVHGELDLGEEKERGEEEKTRLEACAKAIEAALGDKVVGVRLSTRLTETASCLVSKAGMPGANLERIMKILDENAATQKRELEINPDHPFVQNVAALIEKDPASPRIQVWAEMLYDQALLSEGQVEDAARLVKRIQDLLVESSAALLKRE